VFSRHCPAAPTWFRADHGAAGSYVKMAITSDAFQLNLIARREVQVRPFRLRVVQFSMPTLSSLDVSLVVSA
jgi:hypothetical protein